MNGDQYAPAGQRPRGSGEATPAAVPTFTPHRTDHGGSPVQRTGQLVEDRLLTSHLELGALPTAPGSARAHTRVLLTEWGLGELADVAELLVSELTTNAVYASRALPLPLLPSIHFWLRSDRQRVAVTVWDADPRPPKLKRGSVDAENGRGLQLVEALSTRWGWYEPEGMGGKCIWFELVRELRMPIKLDALRNDSTGILPRAFSERLTRPAKES